MRKTLAFLLTATGMISLVAAQAGTHQFAASHILVAYEGATRANPKVTRTKEEALARAQEVILKLQEGADFAEVAGEYSDGPTAGRGGNLGTFRRGQMVPPFQNAVESLDVGDFTRTPVETQFGYHVIQRNEVILYGAKHILVQYAGASRSKQTRSKDSAKARAEECLAKIKAGGDFAELAKEYSDGPSGPRGGDLGTFSPGQMVPAFEEGMLTVAAGNLVPNLVETPFGYHIVFRTH